MKIIFLDRDGVINKDRSDYVKSVSEFEFLPGARESLRELTKAGYKIVVISNQQAVGKGIISKETLEEIDLLLKEEVAKSGGRIDATYYCPHLKDENCDCRKPATGLLERASRDFDVRLEETIFVGDTVTDIEAGKRAGCQTIALLTGKLSPIIIKSLPVKPDRVAQDLKEAVEMILGRKPK